jgi:membrane protease YdiL (CAAX protease family)
MIPESGAPSPAPFPNPPEFGQPPRRDIRWLLLGPHGIRAGWSILIFAGIVVALGFSVSTIVRLFWHPKFIPGAPMAPRLGAINEAVQLLFIFVATWVMSRIEHKPALYYGYQGKARGVRFLSGLAWGFVAISAVVFTLDKLGYLSLDGRALNGMAALHYAAVWGLVFLLVGFFEESTLRGYLQFTTTRGIGFWWGAIILSFLFGFGHGHNPGESPIGLFAAGAIGLVFCLSLWYTGSLWWAVGFHAAWDWGESYFYGTADSGLIVRGHLLREHPMGSLLWSGGSTGPEGSVVVIPVILVIALLMYLWWGQRVKSPFAGMALRPPRRRPEARPAIPADA